MASLNEAFVNLDEEQTKFYTSQQTKYQEVEPNRFLPDKIKAASGLPAPSVVGIWSNFKQYDPYTQKTKASITGEGMGRLLQGEAPTAQAEIDCRQYIGINGLEQLMRDTAENPNMPVRCGWRYKKSPGLIPDVAQGALGTRSGPLNNNATEDALEGGVKWIWNLKDAQKAYYRDLANTLPTGEALSLLPSLAGGNLVGKLGFCSTTNRMIPINDDGSARYPNDPTMNCPTSKIITDPTKLPPAPATRNPVQILQNANIIELKECASDPKAPLSRDCLLRAIKTNGCSDQGTMYAALQLVNANSSRWDGYLNTQAAFTAYQSRQGGDGITSALFEKGKGTWEMALAQTKSLNDQMRNQDPYVRIAARDLCLEAGIFDSYDFCADLTDNTSLNTIDLKCLQNYWQEENGKPAGTAYPTKRGIIDVALGAISTWGEYKQAVDNLKSKTKSSDPLEQRTAIGQFYGVNIQTGAFGPNNLTGQPVDKTPPCLGLGKKSKTENLRVYTKEECDKLKGAFTERKGEDEGYGTCIRANGTSLSFDCKYLNATSESPLEAWFDAGDGRSITMDNKNGVRTWRDKSGKGRNLEQISIPKRAKYVKEGGVAGLYFNGNGYWNNGSTYTLNVSNFPTTGIYSIFIVAKDDYRDPDSYYNNYFIGSQSMWSQGCIAFSVENWRSWWAGRQASIISKDKNSYTYGGWWGNYTQPTYNQTDINVQRRGRPAVWSLVKSAPNTNARIYFNGGGLPLNDQKNPTTMNPIAQTYASGQSVSCNEQIEVSPGGGYKGTFYEIMLYSSALSDVERQKMEGYLANKWGISQDLVAGHPFANGGP